LFFEKSVNYATWIGLYLLRTLNLMTSEYSDES